MLDIFIWWPEYTDMSSYIKPYTKICTYLNIKNKMTVR